MFIPRGKAIHKNLATSYVIVDALVADLCEGGFSGVVEIGLRDRDGHIVIVGGNIAAALESPTHQERDGEDSTQTTVAELTEKSRLERGRVSVYRYDAATATAIAGRINAKPLFAGLTTEFADLERMICKLAREHDREWFIEIRTANGSIALVYMRNGQCRVINLVEDAQEEEFQPQEIAASATLSKLLRECHGEGGTFDVYFKLASEATEADAQFVAFEGSESNSESRPADGSESEERAKARPAGSQPGVSVEAMPNESSVGSSLEAQIVTATAERTQTERQVGSSNSLQDSAGANQQSFSIPAEITSLGSDNSLFPGAAGEIADAEDLDVLFEGAHPRETSDAEQMAEIKRLMGEIAATIEEAAQAVGRHDSFSMSLRAGQLKIADRYPFLDPFGGEFEYLAGEIVFVGQARADEFVAGLTEALKLAVESVTRSTAYADKFHAWMAEDLRQLLKRNSPEFGTLGLDQVIERLISS